MGDSLLYGSSAEHAVHCLDAGTGEVRWSFYAEGPVRFAPAVWQDEVYFGSDDGNVYCVKLASGELVWKYCPSATDRHLPGNGHVISMWPVRTGLVVDEGTVSRESPSSSSLLSPYDGFLRLLLLSDWLHKLSQRDQRIIAESCRTLHDQIAQDRFCRVLFPKSPKVDRRDSDDGRAILAL